RFGQGAKGLIMWKIKEGSPQHWALRLLGVAVIAIAVVWVPTQLSTWRIGQFSDAFVLIIAAMSLNLVLGFTGMISIGHSAFFGIGGYTAAILIKDHGWSPGYTFYAAAVVAFVVGCLIALPALRIKGIYLALVTLAVAVLFPVLVKWKKLVWLTDGAKGIDSVRYDELPVWPFLGELKGRDGRAVFAYWLAFVVLVITYLVCRGLVKSRFGRSLVAIRDNETAASVMGVNLTATKVLVFGISASLCSLAGVLSTLRTGVVTPEGQYVTLLGSIVFLLIMVVGGAGTLWGPIVGGLVYVWLDNTTRGFGSNSDGIIGFLFGWADQSPATMILGVALTVIMFAAPFGLVGLIKKVWVKLVVVVPRPAGTSVAITAAEVGR
ncbi:MAG: branched-chain amino acid ABC transporter permease, partial [Actinomycetota bacterium]|nr:branched-chain amino acid ABC transporter permease [Actinomycetota bacterium]